MQKIGRRTVKFYLVSIMQTVQSGSYISCGCLHWAYIRMDLSLIRHGLGRSQRALHVPVELVLTDRFRREGGLLPSAPIVTHTSPWSKLAVHKRLFDKGRGV